MKAALSKVMTLEREPADSTLTVPVCLVAAWEADGMATPTVEAMANIDTVAVSARSVAARLVDMVTLSFAVVEWALT